MYLNELKVVASVRNKHVQHQTNKTTQWPSTPQDLPGKLPEVSNFHKINNFFLPGNSWNKLLGRSDSTPVRYQFGLN